MDLDWNYFFDYWHRRCSVDRQCDHFPPHCYYSFAHFATPPSAVFSSAGSLRLSVIKLDLFFLLFHYVSTYFFVFSRRLYNISAIFILASVNKEREVEINSFMQFISAFLNLKKTAVQHPTRFISTSPENLKNSRLSKSFYDFEFFRNRRKSFYWKLFHDSIVMHSMKLVIVCSQNVMWIK